MSSPQNQICDGMGIHDPIRKTNLVDTQKAHSQSGNKIPSTVFSKKKNYTFLRITFLWIYIVHDRIHPLRRSSKNENPPLFTGAGLFL
jgi:hypothetical protein